MRCRMREMILSSFSCLSLEREQARGRRQISNCAFQEEPVNGRSFYVLGSLG
jgi:hypothetical protein